MTPSSRIELEERLESLKARKTLYQDRHLELLAFLDREIAGVQRQLETEEENVSD